LMGLDFENHVEPRNPLETMVMCSLHLSCSQRFVYERFGQFETLHSQFTAMFIYILIFVLTTY